jgi:hypothetical protein
MTPKRAKELLPIITAFASGVAIQCRVITGADATWDDATYPQWRSNVEYRIKKEPRLLWAVEGRNQDWTRVASLSIAEKELARANAFGVSGPYKIVCYREVMEDGNDSCK